MGRGVRSSVPYPTFFSFYSSTRNGYVRTQFPLSSGVDGGRASGEGVVGTGGRWSLGKTFGVWTCVKRGQVLGLL